MLLGVGMEWGWRFGLEYRDMLLLEIYPLRSLELPRVMIECFGLSTLSAAI